MNWEAVGAIAEAIASFGVIISLVYLAVHNRKQTVDNRLTTGSELANQIIDMSGSVADNKDLSSLFLKGLRDFDSLDPTEMLQFSAFCNRLFRIAEVMFHQHQRGRLDVTVWSGLNQVVQDFCKYPGMKDWWRTRAHWYSADFRDSVLPYFANQETHSIYRDA